jgi:uncharacterized protein involved in exopolysaccharide biosynthesis
MTPQENSGFYATPVDTDEISLLDLSLVVVDNLRLLVLGPIVAGLVALGVSFLLPRTYESTALLKGKAQVASLITTPAVLDPVIEQLKLVEADESLDEARNRLRRDVKATFNVKDNLVTVTAKARSPERAQALLYAITKSYFGQSKPRASELERLQTLLSNTEARLKEATATARQLSQRLGREDTKVSADLAQGYATLLRSIESLEKRQQELLEELQGLDESQMVQAPTVDKLKTSPKRGLIAVITALATGFALLLFVFIRQALRNGAKNTETATKLATLQASWRKALGKA